MMRTNQIIDCYQIDDDVSVLSTPSFGGDDDNREERQKLSHMDDSRRNIHNNNNNNRTVLSSRIFKPSVVGRAEMLTTREECDPTTTNQQRHLASELKRQRLRRSRIQQQQQQQQQHVNPSPRLETISTNSIEKNNNSTMKKKVDRHSREAIQRCRGCQLPIISVGTDGADGSKVPHCTCFASPPIMPKRNSRRGTRTPMSHSKKKLLLSSSTSESITPRDPHITNSNNSPKEKKKPQLQQQKLSSSAIHSPGGLEYLTRAPSIIPSNCSLQYSSNDDKEEDEEDEEEEDLLVEPPALVRKISIEREFSPKEEKVETISFPITNNDDRSFDVISLPTFISSDNDEPSDSMHETCSKQSKDNLQDEINTSQTTLNNDKNESLLNPPPPPPQDSNESTLIIKPEILEETDKDLFSHALSPSTTVTNKHPLDESSCDDKEDVSYYPSFVISPSKLQIDNSVHVPCDSTPKNSDCGETIPSLDTTHPTSATTCSEDLLTPENDTLSQCSQSSSQEFKNFRDVNKKKWWNRKSNIKLNTSVNCSSPSSSTASTVKANWKRWKSKGKEATSSLKNNRVNRCSPKKDDEFGLLDKEVEKQDDNDPARQDEKLEFDDSCLDFFTDDKSLDGTSIHEKRIPIQEFLEQQCKNHLKNRALVVYLSKAAQRLFSVELYDEALYAHQHALLTSLVVDDHDLDQASILCNNIACSLVACKQYSQAMAYFNHSLSSTPSQKNPMTLMNIGILHVLQNEFNNALDFFYQAKLQVCNDEISQISKEGKLENLIQIAETKSGSCSLSDFVILQAQEYYEF